MKKIILGVLISLLLIQPVAHAFLYDVKILAVSDIEKLSNDQLMETYTNSLIERRASETFHGRAGFSPKEYNQYKDLLLLIVNIRKEMVKREMEVPPIEEWIR